MKHMCRMCGLDKEVDSFYLCMDCFEKNVSEEKIDMSEVLGV